MILFILLFNVPPFRSAKYNDQHYKYFYDYTEAEL